MFTCCATRSAHLELVTDLTAECFIRCFRRFSAQRRLPTRIVSDNAKTFKTADRKLAALFDLLDVQNYLLNQHIKWRYNLPKASWWGRLFERLVGMTKRCLKKIIGKAGLSYGELLTAVTEVEGILNSRPLTYVQSDDIGEVLTPSHLLTGRKLVTLPEISELRIYDDEYYEQLDTREHFTKQELYLSRILKNFWKKWRKDYLID